MRYSAIAFLGSAATRRYPQLTTHRTITVKDRQHKHLRIIATEQDTRYKRFTRVEWRLQTTNSSFSVISQYGKMCSVLMFILEASNSAKNMLIPM